MFAFTLGILVIVAGVFLIWTDKPTEGFIAMLLPLATLLGVFVYREIQSARDKATGAASSSAREAPD